MNDLRFGLPPVAQNPGFTAVAVLILGLGIGANTAMFSVINALLFKPLAVEAPSNLFACSASIRDRTAGTAAFRIPITPISAPTTPPSPNSRFLDEHGGRARGRHHPPHVRQFRLGHYLRTFGVRPALGRDFLPEEERPARASRWSSSVMSSGSIADPTGLRRTDRDAERAAVRGDRCGARGFHGGHGAVLAGPVGAVGVHELLANDFRREQGRKVAERDNHLLMLVGV